MKWNAYERKRSQLANALHLGKPMFSERYLQIVPLMNNIRTLSFVDIKQNVTYGKKQYMLEDKCNEMVKMSKLELSRTLRLIKEVLEKVKEEITNDDKQYEYTVKERRVVELIAAS